MPVACRPVGKPRGRPFLRSEPAEQQRAAVFVERAAQAYSVKKRDVRGSVRPGRMAVRAARNLVARALRAELGWTLQEITDYLGWANHSSARAAVIAVSRANQDAELYAQITAP